MTQVVQVNLDNLETRRSGGKTHFWSSAASALVSGWAGDDVEAEKEHFLRTHRSLSPSACLSDLSKSCFARLPSLSHSSLDQFSRNNKRSALSEFLIFHPVCCFFHHHFLSPSPSYLDHNCSLLFFKVPSVYMISVTKHSLVQCSQSCNDYTRILCMMPRSFANKTWMSGHL